MLIFEHFMDFELRILGFTTSVVDGRSLPECHLFLRSKEWKLRFLREQIDKQLEFFSFWAKFKAYDRG